ncbi:MAG TPA: polysaccharide deacetylase family protein [Bacillaceae bacterium]|nr:polysaccharide deacetylase family protein [Bacillaceae bacterium]
MDRTTRRRMRRLNKKGKIAASLLFALLMMLVYLIWVGISESNAEATKSNGYPVVGHNDQEQNQTPEPEKEEDTPIQGEEVDEPVQNEEDDSNLEDPQTDKESEQPIEEDQPIDENNEETPKNDNQQKDQEGEKDDSTEGEQNVETALKTGKYVYLTFDDGPHPVSKDILALLDKYNAKATFFMLEPNMKNHPEAVKAMVEGGHTVGVHGVTHDKSKVYKSPSNFVNEMEKAISYIYNLTNIDTLLSRAPYGSKPYITPPFKSAADAANLILWDWNIDSVDWKFQNGEFVEKVIEQTERLVNKEPLVVLLHEKPTTLEHLEKLLQYYQKNGYEMLALNEAMTPVQFK